MDSAALANPHSSHWSPLATVVRRLRQRIQPSRNNPNAFLNDSLVLVSGSWRAFVLLTTSKIDRAAFEWPQHCRSVSETLGIKALSHGRLQPRESATDASPAATLRACLAALAFAARFSRRSYRLASSSSAESDHVSTVRQTGKFIKI